MQHNLDREMLKVMEGLPKGTPLLLHTCCGPCAGGVLPRLAGHFDLTLSFYNPNIDTAGEHARRLQALERLLGRLPLPAQPRLLAAEWAPDDFLAVARGLEDEPEGGARCAACFRLRLGHTAQTAARQGFEWFATTLSVSPHKNAALLHQLGSEAAAENGVRSLPADFKKRDGYRSSVLNTREAGIYRQDYCGCVFSRRAGRAED